MTTPATPATPAAEPGRARAIRSYRPGDRAAIYEICIRTADGGGDARGVFDDPDLLPEIFAGPYLHLEPELAFVLADGDEAVGYVLGAADTARFAARFRDEWLPRVTDRYPPLPGPPTTRDELMRQLLHTPERMVLPQLAEYPAHLHIDLLPEYQRAGHGRQLIAALIAALARRGVPGVHLGMAPTNVAARDFYRRVGFHQVEVPDPSVSYLARRIPG